MSQGLKRSQKTDFNGAPSVGRERSFVKPSRDASKRRSHTMASMLVSKAGNKPSMELYRPPNSRAELNVHAKEFTMGQLSRSAHRLDAMALQHSKSIVHLPLLHSASTSHLLGHLPRVAHPPLLAPPPPSLRRSKSAGDSLAARLKTLASRDIDLSAFAEADRASLRLAIEDPNQLPSRTLMDLVKAILERVVEGIRYSEGGAKLCVCIIEREKGQTFLESLLNMCQQWYQERDKILRGVKAGEGTRFTAFMWFLTELCGQLKRRHVGERSEALQPELVLLSVLAKCCQACVSLPIACLSETECLFFVLTSIGRDLEAELPQQLEQLLASVRDGFLAMSSAGAAAVRRTLLQLIELHASNWQLPGSSVLYYYPRVK